MQERIRDDCPNISRVADRNWSDFELRHGDRALHCGFDHELFLEPHLNELAGHGDQGNGTTPRPSSSLCANTQASDRNGGMGPVCEPLPVLHVCAESHHSRIRGILATRLNEIGWVDDVKNKSKGEFEPPVS